MDNMQLPHSPEAEACLVGSVLINPEAYEYITIEPEAFYVHRFRFIWNAIVAVHNSGMGIDPVTVTAELEKRDQLHEIGGQGLIYDVMKNTPDAYNAESYAEIVNNSYTSRKYIEIAQTMLKQSYNGGVDVGAIIEQLTTTGKKGNDGRLIGQAIDDLDIFIAERMADPKEVWGIATGLKTLDHRTGGLHGSHVFMLSGESGTGKTTLALQIVIKAAKEGYGCVIFETEMSEQATLIRMVELECGLPYRAIMSGFITEPQLQNWKAAKARIKALPIYINDDPAISTSDMRKIINRVNTEHFKVDLVLLDYLGNLTDEPEYGKADFDQTRAKRFRELVRYTKVAGISIQDMTKGSDGAPKLQSMSGGAKVRYSADEVYFIFQEETNPRIHYLVPSKERYGDQAKRFITLDRPGLGFKEADTKTINLKGVV